MTEPKLPDDVLRAVDTVLAESDEALLRRYPGDPGGRQPVHTAYVPADKVSESLAQEWGEAAGEALRLHAPDAAAMATATGLDTDAVADVWPLVLAKLDREPVEDLRVDLEDGYGNRGDETEDRDAVGAAAALGKAVAAGTAPPYVGLRFKSLEAPTRRRGLRSLDLFLGSLLDHGPLPDGFVLTSPKVTSVEQVTAMVLVCGALEEAYGLPAARLRFELQIETTQAVLGADGRATVAAMVHAAGGRCSGLHYGTYDYSAAAGVAAAYQSMDHPVADHAKAVMQVAAAGTGVRLSDGSTNLLPVGERDEVHAAWRLHAGLVRRSLVRGFYQGWDLHPAQLPTRYLATYLFFREGLPAAGTRLRRYLDRADSGVLDEPATAQALAAYVVRAVHCGAVRPEEVEQACGIDTRTLDRLLRREPV
jgi:hypothetical protein